MCERLNAPVLLLKWPFIPCYSRICIKLLLRLDFTGNSVLSSGGVLPKWHLPF